MEVDRVTFEADGLKLVGEVYSPSQQGFYPALCLCHGIPAQPPVPGDRGYPLLAEKFCAQGFLVLIFNFRGTGESEGNFDILGWSRDLEAAIDHLCQLEQVDKSRLSVMGFSGGAAVAAYTAAKDKRVSSVVTCACPAYFPLTTSPQNLEAFLEQSRRVGTIRDKDFPPSLEEWAQGFDLISPINWISKISPRPILLVHGDSDEVVDVSHAYRLYQQAGGSKELCIIKGGEHRLRLNEEAMNAALSWLKRVNKIGG